MRIGVVAGTEGWHVLELQRAILAAGHSFHFFDFTTLDARVGFAKEKNKLDRVIVRSMPLGSLEQVIFRMNRLHQLQLQGVELINPPHSLEICIDKFLCLSRLEATGVPVPKTIVCQTCDQAMEAFAKLKENVVVKPLFGSEGRGILQVNQEDMAWRVFHTLEKLGHVIYLQEYLSHPGWDVRVFLWRDQCIAAMKRHGVDDWRTNMARGGRGEAISPSDQMLKLAITASQATGTLLAGVDLICTEKNRWYVLEVNAVPGWRGLSKVCQKDVAAEIIRFIGENHE